MKKGKLTFTFSRATWQVIFDSLDKFFRQEAIKAALDGKSPDPKYLHAKEEITAKIKEKPSKNSNKVKKNP
jgi:hypothetical protein